MCLRPIYIRNDKAGSLQRLPAVQRGNYFLPSLSGFYVPCGKCVDCLHKKHLARVPQYVRELSKHRDNVFVTLTYRNDTVPLSLCVQNFTECVDYETGEYLNYVDSSTYQVLPRDLRSTFVDLFRYDLTGTLRSMRMDSPFGGSEVWRLTPSLNREDVRLFIKKRRVAFFRSGRPLDFKMVCVGEYGPRTSRPHYHLLICGMDFSTAQEFFSTWSDEYGNVCVKSLQRYTKLSDGTFKDNYVGVSYYVSKYMSKGCFECDCAKYEWSEKPRTCVSLDFGCDLTPEEYQYFAPSTFTLSDIPVISQRSYYLIDNVKYPLPSAWKRRLRYNLVKSTRYDIYKQKIVPSYRYLPNPLQVALSDFVRIRFNELAMRKLFQSEDVGSSKVSLSDFEQIALCENSKVESKEIDRFADLREFYAKSVF